MKKHLILFLTCIVCGGGQLLAQKYQPKYLREKDETFKNLTLQTTENGWIEFKAEARICAQTAHPISYELYPNPTERKVTVQYCRPNGDFKKIIPRKFLIIK